MDEEERIPLLLYYSKWRADWMHWRIGSSTRFLQISSQVGILTPLRVICWRWKDKFTVLYIWADGKDGDHVINVAGILFHYSVCILDVFNSINSLQKIKYRISKQPFTATRRIPTEGRHEIASLNVFRCRGTCLQPYTAGLLITCNSSVSIE